MEKKKHWRSVVSLNSNNPRIPIAIGLLSNLLFIVFHCSFCMEDVDRMIVDLLVNDLHCSFADKALKLCDFGAAQLMEGIIRCVWRCRPDSVATLPTYQLPDNPIERFRLASKISHEVQAIGVSEHHQIGYQALLYPNVFDSRHIFLTLFAHFPKETVRQQTAEKKAMSQIERLRTDVGAIIADQIKTKWTPEFCDFYGLHRRGRLWFPPSTTGGSQQQQNVDPNMEEEDSSSNVWTTVACMAKQQQKTVPKRTTPKIAPKPTLSKRIMPRPVSVPTPAGEQTAQNIGEKIHEKIEQKRCLLAQKRRALAALHHANALLAEQIAAVHQHRRTEIDDVRLAQLLAEPEVSRQKLEHYIACADSRKCALEQKFVEAERERCARLEDHLMNNGDNDGRRLAEGAAANAIAKLAELNGTISAQEQLLDQRRHIRQKILRECQKIDVGAQHGDGRAKYVQRILEMSAMVGKQNEEIRRTATSVQNLRKEIEQLMASLERTFIAVDRWLSKNAEGNARMQRAYKLMVRTHEQCLLVMTCIEDHGQLSRHADELVDKIGVEQQKTVDEQLEKLLNDLMLINHENAELETRIAHCSSKSDAIK